MDSPDHPVDPALDPLPAPPATVQWWLVTPSPMAFENVGFSRPVVRTTGDNAGIWSPLSHPVPSNLFDLLRQPHRNRSNSSFAPIAMLARWAGVRKVARSFG